ISPKLRGLTCAEVRAPARYGNATYPWAPSTGAAAHPVRRLTASKASAPDASGASRRTCPGVAQARKLLPGVGVCGTRGGGDHGNSNPPSVGSENGTNEVPIGVSDFQGGTCLPQAPTRGAGRAALRRGEHPIFSRAPRANPNLPRVWQRRIHHPGESI